MTPAALLALFRADVRDEATPPLWSDLEIYSYMDDAQKKFCIETGGIADSSSAITIIPLLLGEQWVAYDKRILKIRGGSRVSDDYDVKILNYEDLGTARFMSDYGNTFGTSFRNTAGPVQAIVVGMDANRMRVAGIPQFNDSLQLSVYRLPLEDIVDASDVFEIDDRHHRHLMDWMKSLGYQKQDAETYDKGKSTEFENRFLGYCAEARRSRELREHKYRTVAYGGY